MRPNNPQLINAQDATAAQHSAAIDGSQVFSGSIQAIFTAGNAAGTLTLQGSNDPLEQLPAGEPPQNWSTVPNATASVSSGALTVISVAQLNFRWYRASWAPSGGSAGTVTVNGFFQSF